MRTSKLLCIAALLACSTLARAEDPRLEARSEADRKTVSVLESLKVSLNFNETTLTEVVDFLREITSLNILISKNVKEKGDAFSVSLKVDDLQASDALSLLLQMLDLDFKIEDGVVLIVTKEELKADVFLQLTDVRDLLFHLRDFKAPEISLADTSGGSEEGGLGIVTVGAEDTEGTLEDPTLLVDLIKKHTCGPSWNDNPRLARAVERVPRLAER